MDDFHIGFFQEREFNTQLLEEERPSLDTVKNRKEMGLVASIYNVWRRVGLKQGGEKETACKPRTLMEKAYYNLH